MDTMKILLGATIALLLGALVMSWQGMNEGVKNTSPDELARLRKQVEELQAQHDRIQREKKLQEMRVTAEPEQQSQAPPDQIAAMQAELAAKEAALQEIAAEKEKAERDAGVYRDEAGLVGQRKLESGDNELRRARLIRDALLIGRVSEYVEDEEYGGFVTIELVMPENVQVGTVLAIRRQTGILGQLKVTDVTPEGAIANPMSGFGPVKPVSGDELILPPQM